METARSADGTTIAYDRTGTGPVVILVDGAFVSRAFGPDEALVPLLADETTAVSYDRRGRGDSGDTPPYAVEREIEDLTAVIDAVGGRAYLYGSSSGAMLAARAAAALPGKVAGLVLYEAPMLVDGTRKPAPDGYRAHVDDLVATGRNADVVKFFFAKLIGLPAFVPMMMRLSPVWKHLVAAAPTLRYDLALLGDTQRGTPIPADLVSVLATIEAPTVVGAGGKSPAWMTNAQDALAAAIPGATRFTLAGQNHQVKPEAIAPVVLAQIAAVSA